MEALKTSGLVTYNIEEADVVFVNSYCYYEWWLGWTNSRGRTQQQSPAEYLIAGFEGMLSQAIRKRLSLCMLAFLSRKCGRVT
jgi:hypothetical protein